ncbi:hypothetical protein FHR99_002655 [Litorivivens lipolytica]|uniref:Probable membrane transporter protein n=1 Tax=Litorivivens lipolytica TaxID=1524264 RepID=A0A7W4W6J4_9GAMM|nr:sulfite exporter TauE/SafE family protein [Litorivivens lipolytica]MBB3048381.1 hypothetical protein [Litorivivens lipolytica]
MVLVSYLLVGAIAGLTAGLFGVGGGLIIVPALVFSFTLLEFPAAILMQLAIGTSLATIVFTSISSVRAHHLYGNVDWPLFWKLAPAIALGVILGVHTAAGMAGALLQLLFGAFALLVALQMGLNFKPKPGRVVPGRLGSSLAGTVIGYVSALFGIGGGSLTVPYLSWSNVRMQQAVGVSAACGLPIALVGFATNIWAGWGREGLPTYSTGFVYWPAFLGIVSTSTLFARAGARLAQRLPERHLKRVFALFLGIIGLQFILRNL